MEGEADRVRILEGERLITILYAILALLMLLLCSFTLTFIYIKNDDLMWEVLLLFMLLMVPFTLNAFHMIIAIVLLCRTELNTCYLSLCGKWCWTSNFLAILIILEIPIFFVCLSQFPVYGFNTLAIVLVALQCLIRISALRRIKVFLENWMNNVTSPTTPPICINLSAPSANIEPLRNSCYFVPFSSRGHHVEAFLPGRPFWIRDTVISNPQGRETPPPSYAEATQGLELESHRSFLYTEAPPIYAKN